MIRGGISQRKTEAVMLLLVVAYAGVLWMDRMAEVASDISYDAQYAAIDLWAVFYDCSSLFL